MALQSLPEAQGTQGRSSYAVNTLTHTNTDTHSAVCSFYLRTVETKDNGKRKGGGETAGK